MCTEDASCCLFNTQPPRQLLTIVHTPDNLDLSAMGLAQFYGFLRHHRVYACAIDGEPLEPLQPSWMEHLLGDG
ncbi:MAG: hypothetical protein AAF827_09685 [Cyanobacteria bacterium P01_D01_bin.6]